MRLKGSKSSKGQEFGLEHVDGLYAYAFVLCGDRTEAEDLVQETYLRAIKAVARLRDDSNRKGWLFTILRNVWLNQLRHRRIVPQISGLNLDMYIRDLAIHRHDDPYSQLVSKMDREMVRDAIQELPTIFREVILLREYEELSYQEIAGVLNIPLGTVMSRLGRARAQLRVLLSAAVERRSFFTEKQAV
jgi:RNA polymerase sigma-70 factor, ECF subfamily